MELQWDPNIMAWLGRRGCEKHKFYSLSLDGVQGRSFVQPIRRSSFPSLRFVLFRLTSSVFKDLPGLLWSQDTCTSSHAICFSNCPYLDVLISCFFLILYLFFGPFRFSSVEG